MSMDESESVGLSLDTSQLNGDCSEFLANDDSQGTFSDTVDSMDEASSSHSSVVADDNVPYFQPSLDRSVLGWETVDGKMAIVFFPDFIVCGNLHWNCIDFKVIFFDNCVRASGSTAHGQEEFCIELAIEDIVDIRSQREGRKEMVEVKINVIARDSQQVLNLDGTSSVEELKFCVVDSLWHEKFEEIISLNVKYKALWNFMLDTDMGVDLEALLSQEILPGPKKFIPEFVENFEEVIYPEGDPDAVSISIRDVDMLKPDTFINDTIIDFYIKYLKNTMILPEERSRFHFFNCFFFRKLADMDKDPSSAFEGRAAFLRVRKWTRKVDLFSKDFIFIPVNYSYHWSLILICHPREIAKISDENAENLARVPCILHMDSLRGSHANLKDLMQSYLWEEWKERQRGTDEAIASKFLNLRFIPLEQLPQQQNLYDCGLFLLHYLESFLEAHLENFSPFMMKKSEIPNFLTSKWFLPDEPYIKRSAIMRLIHGLVNNHHSRSEQHCPSINPKSNKDKENAFELIGAGVSPSKNGSNQHMPISRGGLGIEMDLLQASSFESTQGRIHGSGLVLRELFDPVSSETLLLGVKHQALDRTSSISGCRNGLPPMEEEVEADLQFVQISTDPGSQHFEANDLETSPLNNQSEVYSNKRLSHEEYENSLSYPANPACNSGGPIVAEKSSLGVTNLDDNMDHPNHESAGNTESSRKPEATFLDNLMDLPNHESAGNTESSIKPEATGLDDHMDHPNRESAGNTESPRKPEASGLDDHMDHPNRESAGDTESSRKPEATGLDDLMNHPSHESAGSTEHSRKRECPSDITEGKSVSSCPSLSHHHDNADHPIPFLDKLPEVSLQNNETCVQEDLPATKKLRRMFPLKMDNPEATLSEDLHL